MADMNDIAKRVHDNAVVHGFWPEGRTDAEVLALIHSEWSKALEAYRDEEDMVWYSCDAEDGRHECDGDICGNRTTDVYDDDMEPIWEQGYCDGHKQRPEGIAVELIDGCIRILDTVSVWAPTRDLGDDKFDGLISIGTKSVEQVKAMELPELVAFLHYLVSDAYKWVTGFAERAVATDKLMGAFAAVFLWLRARGEDPVAILREKHEYNITRPYKHGKRI